MEIFFNILVLRFLKNRFFVQVSEKSPQKPKYLYFLGGKCGYLSDIQTIQISGY